MYCVLFFDNGLTLNSLTRSKIFEWQTKGSISVKLLKISKSHISGGWSKFTFGIYRKHHSGVYLAFTCTIFPDMYETSFESFPTLCSCSGQVAILSFDEKRFLESKRSTWCSSMPACTFSSKLAIRSRTLEPKGRKGKLITARWTERMTESISSLWPSKRSWNESSVN